MKNNKQRFTPHQKKVIQTNNHIALTANAGSGKTFVLKYKYLLAAKELKGDLSKIVAITFTNKASSELYKKISELIDEEISDTKKIENLKLLYNIRRNLISAHISTIHSFCVELLRNYPIEAGIDANFIPIDKNLSDELLNLSIQETIDKLFNDESSSILIKELIRYFGSYWKLQSEIRKLFDKRKNLEILIEKIYNKNESEIEKFFDEKCRYLDNQLVNIYADEFIHKLKNINDLVKSEDNENQIASSVTDIIDQFHQDKNFIKFLKNISIIFTNEYFIRQKGYLKSNLRNNILEEVLRVEELYSQFESLINIKNLPYLHKSLSSLGKKILFVFTETQSVYEKKKRINSYIDFDDILIKTRSLLRNPLVKNELSSKFNYILVDEYQDTDEVQYEIIIPLLNELETGNLFIVGDEKQSIYKFRDADLNVFNKTKQIILTKNENNGLQVLPDSFRMVKEICVFTNYVFDRLFNKEIKLFDEVKNIPIICANDSQEKGEVEILISQNNQNLDYLPDMVANKIIELVNSNKCTFNQIAILTRKRNYFDELENVFSIKKIPYKIFGGKGFFQKQIINDIKNYLSFLSNPNDDQALVSILRSPFFLMSDSVLLKINLQNGFTFFDKLKNYALFNKNYKDVVDLLQADINVCSSLPIHKLIKRILSETDFLNVIKNRHNGEQELSNVEKLLYIAREFDENGFRNLYDFVNYLNESYQNNEDEEQSEGELSETGVQIMTIHQSKGLEFQNVFLYRCEDSPPSSIVKSKELFVAKEFGLLFKVPNIDEPLDDYISPPILSFCNFIELAKNKAEVKRLLYVGITRAIKRLFLTIHKTQNSFNHMSFAYYLDGIIDFSKDINTIEDNLTLLKKNQNDFYYEKQNVKLNIKISTFVDDSERKSVETDLSKSKRAFVIQSKKTQSEAEPQIISATKLHIFQKCPLKYHLTYNVGLAKLLKTYPLLRNNLTEEKLRHNNLLFNDENLEEDSLVNRGKSNFIFHFDKLGQIIHRILEREINSQDLTEFFEKQNIIDYNYLKNSEIKNEIIEIVKNFENSLVFKELKNYKNYKNEFTIVIKDENIILKGVIDKIIFSDNDIKVIDYKTDVIEDKSAEEHFREYEIQLKFYLYISMRYFEKIDNFIAKLIFLRNPELSFELNYNREKLTILKTEIYDLIEGIIEKRNSKNLEHCNRCIYQFSNKNCIKN